MDNTTERRTRIFFDMHLPEWEDHQVATRFNVESLAEALIASDTDSVILYAKCQYGNAYYDTALGHKHTGLGSLNLLRSLTDRLHDAGKEVIAYYSVAWDEYQGTAHPEWLTVDRSGSSDSDEFRWKTLCINSPYRAFVFAQLQEIAKQVAVDGFWLDMTIIGSGRCYCKHCSEKFAARVGEDDQVGSLETMDSNAIEFLDFRFDSIEEFYDEAYATLRRVSRPLTILNNYWGYPYSPISMGSRAIGAQQLADVVTGEAYTDWTGLQSPEFFSRFLRGVANGRSFEALIGRFVNTWDFTRKPFDQLFFECMTVFSHGGTVTLDDEPYYDGSFDRQLYHRDLPSIFKTIHKYSYAQSGDRLRYAAVYHSQDTKTVTSQPDFIKDIVGAYKLFRDTHIPVDFVFDETGEVGDLELYQVIFMPSVSRLNAIAREKLVRYVKSGGVIVSCGPNALVEDLGSLGLRTEGASDYSLSYIRAGQESDNSYLLVRGAYERFVVDEQGDLQNLQIVTNPPVVDPIIEADTNFFYHNNLPSPYKDSKSPLAVSFRLGKGGIHFFSQPIARSYAKQPSKGLRSLVLDSVFSLCEKPMMRLRAPFRVSSEVYDDTVHQKLYIHLMVAGCDSSLSCGILDTMQGNFERPFVYMEELERVNDIIIELSFRKCVRTVASIYEKNQLSWKQNEDGLSIGIDGVSLWDIIEVEYEECEATEDHDQGSGSTL